MVHSASPLQLKTARLFLALAMLLSFDAGTFHVRQVYFQSAEPLDRQIYIKNTVLESALGPSQCWQLVKPLYGLCELEDLWHKTLHEHHRIGLSMNEMRSDPALYVHKKDGVPIGLSRGYVDDLIRAGDTVSGSWRKGRMIRST